MLTNVQDPTHVIPMPAAPISTGRTHVAATMGTVIPDPLAQGVVGKAKRMLQVMKLLAQQMATIH